MKWQRATTAALPREIADARASDDWRTPATRQKAVQSAITRAQSVAAERVLPNLKQKVILDGAGHWVQQERPDEVNAALVAFLKS